MSAPSTEGAGSHVLAESATGASCALGTARGASLLEELSLLPLDHGTIRVFGQLQAEPGQPPAQCLVINERPKWGSERTIGLPAETSFVLDTLRAHRQRQRLERITAGAGGWASTMPLKTDRGITLVENDLVFTTQTGRPLSGSYIDEGPFREVCRKAGIAYSTRERKGLRFHDLRHSAATILLAAGVRARGHGDPLPLDARDGEALPARPARPHGRRGGADGSRDGTGTRPPREVGRSARPP